MITVRYFAGAAQAAGLDRREVTPAPGLTVAQAAAREATPELLGVLEVSSYLRDGERVDATTPAGAAAIIDVLPPFAGG
ncbi:MoaD/ThiS family protein [Nanchangia anserum]|uniref:MoaD/ThiS family protein n=1 Tax=Nanchangia anserum TaxID=2692125 RepID=A0A8I0G8E8_9ACTO|nr:MoaD/ThiS family protein [Nanchangia anserum]MBD3689054.1 MoaD/ThiS family protein [Nanchangia anserum]QOX81296.1 MoaD/ThiS family protein [Nanchangia anserum]